MVSAIVSKGVVSMLFLISTWFVTEDISIIMTGYIEGHAHERREKGSNVTKCRWFIARRKGKSEITTLDCPVS
jgi:hypothetical protein